jgi:hypothetical protein
MIGVSLLDWSRVGTDLSAMHDAPHIRGEFVSSMHRAAIVPNQQVPYLPTMMISLLAVAICMRPQGIE